MRPHETRRTVVGIDCALEDRQMGGGTFTRQRGSRIVLRMLFVETSAFTKHLPAHLDDDSYAALQALLAAQPDAGRVIRGSGGLRKIRWGSKGRGKRGGIRVIYYWRAPEGRIYLLTVYGKGVKADLTAAERAGWRRVVEEIEHE